MEERKTTKADFDLFKKEATYWISRFGLFGWDVLFTHADSDGAAAYIYYPDDIEDRLVTIGLATSVHENQYSQDYIRKLAFHEVMELFLYPLVYIAADRYANKKSILEANHNIIMTLEHALFEHERRHYGSRRSKAEA